MLTAVMLAACSSHTKAPPSFTASGYIADRGAVRLWRKDDQARQATTIISVFSPYKGDNTVVTRYEFLEDDVRQINQTQSGVHPQTVQIRFDAQGNTSFMQRLRTDQRESLTTDALALYQFEAKRILDTSQTLRAGKVILIQGQWQHGVLTTCQGNVVAPDFDRRARAWLAARAKHSTGQLGVAWLEAPEGVQLLLVANENFCHWQPKKQGM
ncbi:DUF1481 domain-containing protein [Acerihabitans sp. TG2]|uniref:DUF1481 domain-containing protein n=1 Tax=Acerihabitans sp. TG2 TaxID=3096008 RepID=UPI002B235137|nr:DUF1481 domain-containing protein [Acerihabitans sp. TG2]MEA9393354.1 DUF1481 domain-containing protein [Acerihabitans sp. TG2]